MRGEVRGGVPKGVTVAPSMFVRGEGSRVRGK